MRRNLTLLAGAYLFALSATAAAAPPTLTPALLAKGKTAYAANCVICHGEQGDGNGLAGAGMNPKPRNFAVDKFKAGDKPDAVFHTVTNGLPGTAMTAFGFLPEEDRWALASYILTFRKPKK